MLFEIYVLLFYILGQKFKFVYFHHFMRFVWHFGFWQNLILQACMRNIWNF